MTLRDLVLLAFFLIASVGAPVGCSEPAATPKVSEPAKTPAPAAAVTAPAPVAPVAAPAAPAAAPVAPPVVVAPEAEAAKVYAATFTAGDGVQYLAAYAEQMVCFEAIKPARRDDVRKARVAEIGADSLLREGRVAGRPPELRVVDPATVLLVDRGVYLDDELRPRVHERAVLLRKTADVWQIAGETGLAGAACLGVELGAFKPDPAVAACDTKARACVKACPCKGASNSCESCKDGCTEAAVTCLGIDREG